MIVAAIAAVSVGASSVFFYITLEKSLSSKINAYIQDFSGQVNDLIDSRLEAVNLVALSLMSSTSLRDGLQLTATDEKMQRHKTVVVEDLLRQLLLFDAAWSNKYINSVFIFLSEDECYSVQRNSIPSVALANNREAYLQAKQNRTQNRLLLVGDPNNYYIAYPISDLNLGRDIATMVLTVPKNIFALTEKFTSAYASMALSVYDAGGRIYCTLAQDDADGALDRLYQAGAFSGGDFTRHELGGYACLVKQEQLSRFGLISLIVIPENEAFSDLQRVSAGFFVMLAVLLPILLAICYSLAAAMTRPIDKMMSVINDIGRGNFSATMERSGITEINELQDVLEHMSSEIERLISEVYERRIIEKESELKFLQAQINPHFLFNALECISWQATDAGQEKLSEMVWSLGQLLRAGIYLREDEKVTFREEFEYIGFYLYLQKARFGEKLQISTEVRQQEIFDMLLPKLALQCIVENAVVHGLENKRGQGSVNVFAELYGGDVIVHTVDNGVGFDAQKLDLDHPPDGGAGVRSHVGLYNTNKRLKLFYGEHYGLTIKSTPSKGTEVIIRLPQDRGEMRV